MWEAYLVTFFLRALVLLKHILALKMVVKSKSRTQNSRVIGKHANHYTAKRQNFIEILLTFQNWAWSSNDPHVEKYL